MSFERFFFLGFYNNKNMQMQSWIKLSYWRIKKKKTNRYQRNIIKKYGILKEKNSKGISAIQFYPTLRFHIFNVINKMLSNLI